MNTFFIVLAGALLMMLLVMLTLLSVAIFMVLQNVYKEALHTNGRLKELEGKGYFQAGEKAGVEAEHQRQKDERVGGPS